MSATRTRCKFYVSSLKIDSTQPQEGMQTYRNATIHLNAAYSPDNSTENHSFWNATPVGSIVIHRYKGEGEEFAPGSFWYVDITPDENGDWAIEKNDKYDFNINVELVDKTTVMNVSKITLSVSNKNVLVRFRQPKIQC